MHLQRLLREETLLASRVAAIEASRILRTIDRFHYLEKVEAVKRNRGTDKTDIGELLVRI
jgi:hypothetical protein